jgi:hypothetical protein
MPPYAWSQAVWNGQELIFVNHFVLYFYDPYSGQGRSSYMMPTPGSTNTKPAIIRDRDLLFSYAGLFDLRSGVLVAIYDSFAGGHAHLDLIWTGREIVGFDKQSGSRHCFRHVPDLVFPFSQT